ncbi:MAG TPA: dockerin type I domain-containing protein [Candidatus Hydrogenedentes bacterium]|nr:dockerin type I domain-containing protein [Candidatus Hydrogenedentota bacterium]HPA02788.1 dockerin type I domain-containing protein [Candidatus Hydrogenedentota bacterium]HQM31942.1 dockerin type I domain-containing protein [Candidatus Hydrogenedentota bacterium]
MTMPVRAALPLWVLTASFVFLSLSVSASDAFVDAALGDDVLGNGTAVRPWASIQKALQTTRGAEATVWVGPGTYRERVVVPSALTTVCLIGPGAAHAAIDATSIAGDDAALVLSPGQRCWVEGLALAGGGHAVPVGGEAIRRNGAELELAGCAVTYLRTWSEPAADIADAASAPPAWALEAPAKVTPEPGFFAGFNNQNLPMTVIVASNAQELRSFRFTLRVPCQDCTLNTSAATEWWSDAPRIANGRFDFTLTLGGGRWRFTGMFENARAIDGSWYAPASDGSCGVCSGQGTWSVVRELFQPDVNRDEVIDAVDIQLVINQALALLPTTGGDINGDGEANAIDIQLVVNAVLGMVRR